MSAAALFCLYIEELLLNGDLDILDLDELFNSNEQSEYEGEHATVAHQELGLEEEEEAFKSNSTSTKTLTLAKREKPRPPAPHDPRKSNPEMTKPKPATNDAVNDNSKHSNPYPAAAAAATRTTQMTKLIPIPLQRGGGENPLLTYVTSMLDRRMARAVISCDYLTSRQIMEHRRRHIVTNSSVSRSKEISTELSIQNTDH